MTDGIQKEAQSAIARGPFPWQRGWAIVKAIWPQLIYISMAAIAIPQYVLYLTSSHQAAGVARILATHKTPGLFPLLEIVEKFCLSGMLNILWAALLAIWGYLAWVTAIWQFLSGQEIKTSAIIRQSLRILVPSGLITLFLFALCFLALLATTAVTPAISLITQLLLISFCVLAAAAPVLLVFDRPKARQVLKSSLTMDYTKGSGVTRWSAYFVLMTYEMLLVGSLSLIQAGLVAFNHLDMHLGLTRTIWFKTTETLPFGLVPMLAEGVAVILSALMFALFAVMSTSFIAELTKIGRNQPTIQVRV